MKARIDAGSDAAMIGALDALPLFRWFVGRNARYQRLDQVIPEFRLGNQDPTFVFELRQIRSRAGLQGTSVSL